MRKFFSSVIVLGASLFFVAGNATALTYPPTLSVTPSCSGLKVIAQSFEQPRAVRINNRITINVDGTSFSQDFGTLYSVTIPWSDVVDHSYVVTVDANRVMGLPTAYDKYVSGVQPACNPSVTP